MYNIIYIAVKTDTKQNMKDEIEKDWRLILHDDTVHTIQQVCDIVTMVQQSSILITISNKHDIIIYIFCLNT